MADTTSTSENEQSNSGNLLEIDNLASGYGGVAVIRGVNLYVAPGEVVALLGPWSVRMVPERLRPF